MDSTIVASLITAAASILVALISKGDSAASAPKGTKTRAYTIPRRNRRIWTTVVCILVNKLRELRIRGIPAELRVARLDLLA